MTKYWVNEKKMPSFISVKVDQEVYSGSLTKEVQKSTNAGMKYEHRFLIKETKNVEK